VSFTAGINTHYHVYPMALNIVYREELQLQFPSIVVQGASGIDARFLKWSPALTVCPIMAKFSQYNPHSTYHLVLVSICRQD
jgi:hypothetical protein